MYFEKNGYKYHRSKTNAPEADLCKTRTKHPTYYLAGKKKLIAELEKLRGCKVEE